MLNGYGYAAPLYYGEVFCCFRLFYIVLLAAAGLLPDFCDSSEFCYLYGQLTVLWQDVR